MFEEWKEQTDRYVQKHINRKLFLDIADELDADIRELSRLYTSVLLEHGVIDEHGDETDLDFDEDDLIDTMLTRFLENHGGDDERELLYATLIDAYLAMVEEVSEDM